jgi:hypothetical protein
MSNQFMGEHKNVICFSCKHFLVFGCDAFPDGIPDIILSGKNKHNRPLPDQGNKIVYEKKDSRA